MSNAVDPMRSWFQGIDIISSGLRLDMQRADIVAANLGNMLSTGNASHPPYRRKTLEFAEVLDGIDSLNGVAGGERLAAGVAPTRVVEDTSDFPKFLQPGHKDAGPDGFVWTSNVDLFQELVDMTAIERSFEANLQAMRTYRQMLQNSIQAMGRS
ncbi:MAG: flagellar basal body rod protein FlgC [Planctomycetota bacterium]